MLRTQLDRCRRRRNLDWLPGRERRGDLRRHQRRDRPGADLGLRAEQLAQRAEVRLHRDLDEVARVREPCELHNVELVGHLAPQVGRQLAPAGRRDQRATKRLAGLDVRLGPRRPAQLDQPPHEGHLRAAQIVPDGRGICGPAGQMHRVDPGRIREQAPHTRSVTNGMNGASNRVSTDKRRAGWRAPPGRRPRTGGASAARTSSTGRRCSRRAPARRARCRSRPAHRHLGDEPARLRLRPPIEHRRLAAAGAGRPTVRPRVQRLERRHRPVRANHLGRDLVQHLVPDPPGRPRRAAATMNQRTASAPCWSISGIGSRMLPRCLLILRPSSARRSPRHRTVR